MDLIGKVRSGWKEKFSTEIPDELITRLVCHISKTLPDYENVPERVVEQVCILTSVMNETNRVMKELNSKLRNEEFYLDLLSGLIGEVKENTDRRHRNSKPKLDVQVSTLYAQVNRDQNKDKNKQDSTGLQNDTKTNNPMTVNTYISKPVIIDESPYEQIHFKTCNEKNEQKPHKGTVRGSIKNKIKLFENSDSSSSEASPGVEGDYTQLKVLKSPPKLVRPPRNNEYEEISIKLSLQQKSGSLNNTDMPSLHSQTSDNNHVDKGIKSNFQTKPDLSTYSNQMLESDSNTNGKQKGPPVPARRSKYLDKEDIDKDFNRTEMLTLQQSDHGPPVASSKIHIHSNIGDHKVDIVNEKNNNTLCQKRDYDSLVLCEGEYCSIKDAYSEVQHVSLSDTTCAGKKDIDNRCSNNNKKALFDKKNPAKELSCTSENLSTVECKISKESSSLSKSDDLKHDNSFGEYCSLREIGKLSSNNEEMTSELGHTDSAIVSGKKGQDVEVAKFSTFKPTQNFLQTVYVNSKVSNDKNFNINSIEKSLNVLQSSELGKSNRNKKNRVPDYEKWNFQALLTHTGISIADNDNLTDTGSDEDTTYDTVAVTDKQENNFGLNDDSGVCEIVLTPEEKSEQDDEVSCENLEERIDSIGDSADLSCTNSSTISLASCVNIDTDDISLQQCDSLDGLGILDDDKVSFSSIDDDMVDKNNDVEDPSNGGTSKTKQLRMRHLVVKGILESEKAYLCVLEQLITVKNNLHLLAHAKENASGTIAIDDIATIFYKMEEFQKIHKIFADQLDKQVADWKDDTQIAFAVKELVFSFKCYEEYVQNYPKALETIQKYQKNEDTRQLLEDQVHDAIKKEENLKLEDVLLKPVQRIQTNHLVLHDLIKHTPEDHPDFEILQRALKLSEENLCTYKSLNYGKKEEKRQLVKSGFVVEVSRDKKQTRHLRFVLLFSDVLICTKYKGTSKQKDSIIKYVWSLPLAPLTMHYKGDHQFEQKESLEDLKTRIYTLKCELRDELLKVDGVKEKTFSLAQRRIARNVEKLKKKIQEQEASLVEGLPRLPLFLDVQTQRQQEGFKQRTFLFSTDYEREEWREAIELQYVKCQGMPMVQLLAHDCEVLINHNKVHIQINSIGSMLLMKEEDMLNGSLNVTIHKMQGLNKPCDVYCCLEMDSYGHFYKKAQTTVSHFVTDASWNEDFELELDDSQTLRILCYKKLPSEEEDTIIGKCALELSMDWLNSKFNEKAIYMNEICLTISVRHTPASKTLPRTQSKLRTGIFGVRLSNVIKRERKTVPSIVTICLQQVEKRGLHEVGLYRVSGVTSDILYFKKLFNKNVIQASNQIEEADIHAITGLLKMYLRELPEPLFTDKLYQQFIQTIQLQNEDGKEKCLLELLHSLPEPNYYTIVYIIEHLVRVSARSADNKMSMANLSTIFGPTLMHPAIKDANSNPMAQMALAARDASLESEIIHFFIHLSASEKTLRKSVAIQ